MTRVGRTLRGMVCVVVVSALWPAIVSADTIAAGAAHTVVVTPDGHVWTWGYGNYGALGHGLATDRSVPGEVSGLTDVVAVAAGLNHTVALKSDGTVWAWGETAGGIGDGTTNRRYSPVQLSLTNVVAIAAGGNHSAAIKNDGSVWLWGYNNVGQLGDGTSTTRLSPTQVTGFGTASAVSVGHSHTMVLRTDGTVYTSGGNWSGELGNGNTTHQYSPVQMTGITTATKIAAGRGFSLVLKSNQTLWAAGYNGLGQLGVGGGPNQSTAVQITSLSNVVAMSAGEYHAIALTTSGVVWGWGDNPDGRVGDGTTTRQYSPVAVVGPSTINKVTTGQSHSLAVTTDGVVWVWGNNGQARLGDGTTLIPPAPITISGPDYAWKVGTPTFSVGSGTYSNNQTVVIASATPGAEIHYTLDGNEPTESDPTIASGSSVVIDRPRTLKARAWKASTTTSHLNTATYAMVVATPFLSPGSNIYTTPQTVSISTSTSSATLRYTTDGSTPTASSAQYSGPLSVNTSTTLKVIGFRTDWTNSTLASATYTMRFGTLAAPTFGQPTGTYTTSVSVSLSASAGATIRYTTNGSNPTDTSTIYTAPLDITTTTTLKAMAFHPDYYPSPIATATYTIHVAAPTFSLASGTHPAGTPIVVSTATPGATITYTLHGTDPQQTDPSIASGGSLVVGTFLLKAKAWKTGTTPSAVTSATYAVTGTSAVPMVSANATSSFALKSDGTLWAWGNNRLAINPPALVPGLTGMIAVDAGKEHILAVRSNGTVVAWGVNGGRLGDGTTGDRFVPGPVSTLTDITAVAGGYSHSVARKSDGTVWTWGINDAGQLGNGNTTTQLTPVQVPSLTDVVAVDAGERITAALKSDGTVWTWGTANYGLLGDGSTTARSTPGQVTGLTSVAAIAIGVSRILVRKTDGTVMGWGSGLSTTPAAISGLSSIASLATSSAHALALTGDAHVWSWGFNFQGQVGDGTNTNRVTPAAIADLSSVTSIAAGDVHSLSVDASQVVWAWGDNYYGELGDSTFINRNVPVAISGPNMNWKVRTPVLSLEGGTYSTPQTVTVTCGETDLLPTLHYTITGIDPTETDPTVACGGTLGVTTSQTLKVNGWRTGAPTSLVTSATYELKVVTPTLQPASGRYVTPQVIGLTTSTPGVTYRYTLDGSDPSGSSPIYTSGLSLAGAFTFRARAFKEGWATSDGVQRSYWIDEGIVQPPAMSPAGGTYASAPWVSLTSPTAGATIRYTTDGTTPTLQSAIYRFAFRIPVSTVLKAQAFKVGFAPSPVTTATYTLDAAGTVTAPVLSPEGGTYTTFRTVTVTGPAGATLHYTTTGLDPTEADPVVASGGTIVVDRSLPLKVRAWQANLTPSAIRRADYQITGALAAGSGHTVALKADGTVWAWGQNDSGQVGDSSLINKLSPVQVTGLTDVVAIGAGTAHSLAVKRNGSVWAWGANDRYQLGDNTQTPRNSPVQVSGLTNVVAVAAGAWHSLALKADGTVWAWGNGWQGQIGDGTGQIRPMAVQVMGVSRVVRIAASEFTSYAIDGGGSGFGALWAWGAGNSGQIGNGEFAGQLVPVRVVGLDAVAEIAACYDWAAAIRNDGTLHLWGRNSDAEMAGATSAAVQSLPIASPFLGRGNALALGWRHGVMLGGADGRVWAWGANDLGQTAENSYPYAYATPHPVLQIQGWTAAAAGGGHTIVADATGAIWVVGYNNVGQLGDGTTTPQWTRDVHKLTGFKLADNAWLNTDPDGDGLLTWREFLAHTDPLVIDSDGDGIPDGAALNTGRTPDDPDPDGDGSPNWEEAQRGTDPFRADTDGDTIPDRVDLFPLDPTRSQLPAPDPNDQTPPVITLVEPTNARPIP